MSRRAKAGAPKTISPSSLAFEDELLDIDHWPHGWRVEPRDMAPGQRLLDIFKVFLVHLLSLGRARTTLRVHRDNLSTLGGQIIRLLHENPSLRTQGIVRVLAEAIDDDGGPIIYPPLTEPEQRSFDSTCRLLHRFMRLG